MPFILEGRAPAWWRRAFPLGPGAGWIGHGSRGLSPVRSLVGVSVSRRNDPRKGDTQGRVAELLPDVDPAGANAHRDVLAALVHISDRAICAARVKCASGGAASMPLCRRIGEGFAAGIR